MSAEAWERETNGIELLRLVENRASERKLRLFACCCVRYAIPHLLRKGIDGFDTLAFAERLADGARSGEDEWLSHFDRSSADRTRLGGESNTEWALGPLLQSLLSQSGSDAAWMAIVMLHEYEERSTGSRSPDRGAGFFHELFGNPFVPIDFTPWRTDTAVALAAQMYESRDFSAMPVLADALQDEGCDNNEVLAHCRDANATHVRGCWVVDGVLGKE